MGKIGAAGAIACFALALLASCLMLFPVPASATQLTGSSTELVVASRSTAKISVGKLTVSPIPAQRYRGRALVPKPVVKHGSKTLKAGTDYSLKYRNNVRKGTATVVVTGKGRYTGRVKVHFRIVKGIRLSKAKIAAVGKRTYTGKAKTPKPKVTLGGKVLKRGTNYTLSYKNNVNAGVATVTAKGRGIYVGTRSVTFRIARASISSASIAAIPNQMNTGGPIAPKPKVAVAGKTLVEGRDYTLTYKNNVVVGRATVTVAGRGNYCGSISTGFNIVVPSLSGIRVHEGAMPGEVGLDMPLGRFNKVFSYGDSLDVEFSNGYALSGVPYYNGYYAELGAPLVVSYSAASDPVIATNYGPGMWDAAGLSEGDTVTIRLAKRGLYRNVQDSLNITYSDNRDDFPSDAAFANFRQVTGGKLSGNLFRSATPICNYRKRAASASSLAQSAGVAFVLNLSDSSEEIGLYIGDNRSKGIDTSYYEGLVADGRVLPLGMGNAYSTPSYQVKLAAGLSEMAHRDGPYLVHCLEGKDRTGFACMLLAALAEASYGEMLDGYMATYANYCGITPDGAPDRYRVVQRVCFDSMVGFLMDTTDAAEGDYVSAARTYLTDGGMSFDDIDLLLEKLTH